MRIVVIKIASIFIAFLVLFSTFSFRVDNHYCEGFLIAVSYAGETEVCKNNTKSNLPDKTKDCCSDEVQTIEGQDELQIQASKKPKAAKEDFIATNFVFHSALCAAKFSEDNTPKKKSLKTVLINYQVRYQSFLI
jgi:hypothetical protein